MFILHAIESLYRTSIDKHFDDIAAYSPEKGYELCAIDCFEVPGEMLQFLGYFKTYEEALAAKKKWCGDGEGNELLILRDNRAVEPE